VASVRHHVEAQAHYRLPEAEGRRSICALSVLAHTLMHEPEALDAAVMAIAQAADLDETLVLRAARQTHEQLEAAVAQGR
jgi:gamma-glutamylcysteine synthetase